MKYILSLALLFLLGCDCTPSVERRVTVRTHVEHCFLNSWTFVDKEGYITYREIQGSPFDCEIFDNKDVELTTEGDHYIQAKFIDEAK